MIYLVFGFIVVEGCTPLKHDRDSSEKDSDASADTITKNTPATDDAGGREGTPPKDDAGGDNAGGYDGSLSTDDAACEALTLYADQDGDGRGNPNVVLKSCEQIADYVEQAGDCNDNCANCYIDNTEECDGLDNDCDGETDELEPRACGSQTGNCEEGVQTCEAGQWSNCVGAVLPRTEICDTEGKDEDCDGISNEGCTCSDGETLPCGVTDDGPCELGTQTCTNGAWGDCVGNVDPGPKELCDKAGVDENCDNYANEGCICIEGDTEDCGDTNIGECEYGTKTCTMDGQWGPCIGEKKSKTETCNGKDDDCDGQTDENAPCPTGMYCSAGACKKYCGNGTIDTGEECDDGNPTDDDLCTTECKRALYGYCENDGDCPGTLTCLPLPFNSCTKPCQVDSECPAPYYWSSSVRSTCSGIGCVLTCGNASCPPGMVCEAVFPFCSWP